MALTCNEKDIEEASLLSADEQASMGSMEEWWEENETTSNGQLGSERPEDGTTDFITDEEDVDAQITYLREENTRQG